MTEINNTLLKELFKAGKDEILKEMAAGFTDFCNYEDIFDEDKEIIRIIYDYFESKKSILELIPERLKFETGYQTVEIEHNYFKAEITVHVNSDYEETVENIEIIMI